MAQKKRKFEQRAKELIAKKVLLQASAVENANGNVIKKLYVVDPMGKNIELVADTDYQTESIIDSILSGNEVALEATKQTLLHIDSGIEVDKMRYTANLTFNNCNYNIPLGVSVSRFGGNLGASFVNTKFEEAMLASLFGVKLRSLEETEEE